MTCTYICKTQTTYTEEHLQLAVEQIKKGEISLGKASEAYNKPKSNHMVELEQPCKVQCLNLYLFQYLSV